MPFKKYFFALPLAERKAFAKRCKTSARHLTNVAYGYKVLGEKTCVLVEVESGRAVTRKHLRKDWREIWPELATPKAKV